MWVSLAVPLLSYLLLHLSASKQETSKRELSAFFSLPFPPHFCYGNSSSLTGTYSTESRTDVYDPHGSKVVTRYTK